MEGYNMAARKPVIHYSEGPRMGTPCGLGAGYSFRSTSIKKNVSCKKCRKHLKSSGK